MDSEKQMLIKDYFKKSKLEAFIKYCESNNIIYMNELKNFDFSLLSKIKGMGNVKRKVVKDKCKFFFETPNIFEIYDIDEGVLQESIPSVISEEYLINQFKKVKNYEHFYLYNDIATGKEKTYLDLSKKYSIHISNVRRFFIKTVENIKKYFNKVESYLIENIFKEKKSYTIDDFKAFYTNEDDFNIISLFFEYDNSNRIKYYKELDKIIVDADFDIHNLLSITNEFIMILPKFNDLEKYYIKLSEIISNESKILTINDLKPYLLQNGYVITENNLVRKEVFSTTVINLIIKNEYKNGIELTDENVNIINDKAFKKFNINHFVTGDTIRYSNILSGRNTYISPENITINYNLLHKIKDYINKEFETIKIIPIAVLFNLFKDELLEKTEIDNKYYLYGILHYFLADDFDFKRYFVVKKDYKQIKTPELLEKYILDKKGPVLLSDIIDDLKLDKKTIESAVVMNKNLMFFIGTKNNKRKIIHKKFIDFSSEFKKNLEQLIDNSMNNNISVLHELFENNKEYFTQNGIKDSEYLFFAVKHLLKNFYISEGYIISKNHPDFSEMRSKTAKEKYKIKYNIITQKFSGKMSNNLNRMSITDLIRFFKSNGNMFSKYSTENKTQNDKKFELKLAGNITNKKIDIVNNILNAKNTVLTKTKLHYSDIENYAKKLNLTQVIFYDIVYLMRKWYYQIGKDVYYLKTKFEFEEEIVEFLKNNLSDLLKNEEYCALDDDNIYKNFPAFKNNDLFWNQHILKLYIDKYFPEYRFIKPFSKHYFRIKYIIVKNESHLKNLTDIILFCLKKDFSETKKFFVKFIRIYLMKKNLISYGLNKDILNNPQIQEILIKY